MRHRIIVLSAVLFLSICLPVLGQEKPSEDFFPLEPGTRFVYEIEIGYADAVVYRKLTSFSSRRPPRLIERNLTSAGIILNQAAADIVESTGVVSLILSVKDSSTCNSPWGTYSGMEIQVERDDLNFYRGHRKVFWAIIEKPDYFCIREIVEYGPEIHDFRGVAGWFRKSEQLYSTRIIFHTGMPNMIIKSENDPADVLKFSEKIEDICIFTRQYCSNEIQSRVNSRNNDYRNDNQFEEEITPVVWEKLQFRKGKGLVFLEQMVGNDISMIWTLQN